MAQASLKKGARVESWCTRCREMTEHIIAVLEAKAPRRVTCTVCDGTHNYRPSPPRSRTSAKTKRGGATPKPSDWEELMGVADLDSVRPYAMRRAYAKGDVINHKVFGLGIVVREVTERKMEVSFQDGVRLLACNMRK